MANARATRHGARLVRQRVALRSHGDARARWRGGVRRLGADWTLPGGRWGGGGGRWFGPSRAPRPSPSPQALSLSSERARATRGRKPRFAAPETTPERSVGSTATSTGALQALRRPQRAAHDGGAGRRLEPGELLLLCFSLRWNEDAGRTTRAQTPGKRTCSPAVIGALSLLCAAHGDEEGSRVGGGLARRGTSMAVRLRLAVVCCCACVRSTGRG